MAAAGFDVAARDIPHGPADRRGRQRERAERSPVAARLDGRRLHRPAAPPAHEPPRVAGRDPVERYVADVIIHGERPR